MNMNGGKLIFLYLRTYPILMLKYTDFVPP